MITLAKSELKETIEKAVNELQNAPDKHNCGGYMVKVYLNEEGELYHTIQQGNWWNQGHTEILRFEYSRPDYDTDQDLLDDNGFEGTIPEWDWDNFNMGEDHTYYVEELLDQAIENCRDRGIEIN
jgi:hypothetical protein